MDDAKIAALAQRLEDTTRRLDALQRIVMEHQHRLNLLDGCNHTLDLPKIPMPPEMSAPERHAPEIHYEDAPR